MGRKGTLQVGDSAWCTTSGMWQLGVKLLAGSLSTHLSQAVSSRDVFRIHLITLLRTCNTTFGLSVGNVSLRSIGLLRPAIRLHTLGVYLTLQMINPTHRCLADPEFLWGLTVRGMTGSPRCVDRALERGFLLRCRPL